MGGERQMERALAKSLHRISGTESGRYDLPRFQENQQGLFKDVQIDKNQNS